MIKVVIKGNVMTPEGKNKLKLSLARHEGYSQFPYVDITGHSTIGIGRNLTDRGISTSEAYYLLEQDIDYFTIKLTLYLKFFKDLDENRQIALIDMCFNLGIQGILNFTKMILALEAKDFERASQEMLKSKWADQVKERAMELSEIIRTGQI